jgi:hypothetical protein
MLTSGLVSVLSSVLSSVVVVGYCHLMMSFGVVIWCCHLVLSSGVVTWRCHLGCYLAFSSGLSSGVVIENDMLSIFNHLLKTLFTPGDQLKLKIVLLFSILFYGDNHGVIL